MVDASVGGKVGIDLPEGKNLVGQFYPARIVAVDPRFLSTLPAPEWAAGMAEVIKHGVLEGEPFWSQLCSFRPNHRSDPRLLEELLIQAVMVKVRVVREDPYERTGLRATLNLGHSFGHAVEWCAQFKMSHGEAVALGLLAGLRLSRALNILKDDFEGELMELLQRWELPTVLPRLEGVSWDWELFTRALGRDKKNKNGQWNFILPVRIGEVTSVTAPPAHLVRAAYQSLQPEGAHL
jgi:3-dehydroquinate synthetase